MKTKSFLLAAAVAAMAFTFFACSGDGHDDDVKQGGGEPELPQEPQQNPQEPSNELGVVLENVIVRSYDCVSTDVNAKCDTLTTSAKGYAPNGVMPKCESDAPISVVFGGDTAALASNCSYIPALSPNDHMPTCHGTSPFSLSYVAGARGTDKERYAVNILWPTCDNANKENDGMGI